MKALLTSLSSAALLTAAVMASGCPLDAATLCAIAFAAGLAGLFVSDYNRKPASRPAAVRSGAPARLAIRRPRTAAGFASVIVFETHCA